MSHDSLQPASFTVYSRLGTCSTRPPALARDAVPAVSSSPRLTMEREIKSGGYFVGLQPVVMIHWRFVDRHSN